MSTLIALETSISWFQEEVHHTSFPLSVGQVLRKKRDGEELTKNEIEFLIQSIIRGSITESQLGALLMAIYIKGLSDSETINLTYSMVTSGECLCWRPEWEGILVDKHSTGGVGDKISLVLAPILAACGLKVPMISGRSLEHTGGTLDKLESIPGFNVELDINTMQKALDQCGCFISAATSQICPADKIMYRIRDITSTVDYANLIVASIVSKKVASGSKFLIIDVKVGKGAFCKTVGDAQKLAHQLMKVSKHLGLHTRVVLSRMDEPTGTAIGSALEVTEAIQCLMGRMPSDIAQLVSVLGCNLLEMTNYQGDGEQLIKKVIADGSALKQFCAMLAIQGVKEETIQGLVAGKPVVPAAKYTTQFKVQSSGWVSGVDALVVGQVCLALGAGRRGNSTVDPRVGAQVHCKVGDRVSVGQLWLTVHHSSPSLPDNTEMCLQQALAISQDQVATSETVLAVIKK